MGGLMIFLAYIKETPSISDNFHALMILAMATTYSDGGLPVDENCKFDDEKWAVVELGPFTTDRKSRRFAFMFG